MEEHYPNERNARVARTLGIGAAAPADTKPAVASTAAARPAAVNADVAAWKETARKELEAEIGKQYEARYAQKLKDTSEKQEQYKKACTDLAELLTAVKKSADQDVAASLEKTSSITVMLVLESLYKIIGADDNYQDYVTKVVQESVASLGESIHVKGALSPYDYRLLTSEPFFAELKQFIQVDESLARGQFILDNGATRYQVGILDRLDALKAAFLSAVSSAK